MENFNATEELANLKNKLEATRAKFDVWNDDVIAEMKDWFSQFDANINKHEAHLNELKEGLNTLKEHNLANQEAATEGLSSLEDARRYLKSVQECIHISEAEKNEAEAALRTEEEKLRVETEALLATEQTLKQRTAEMSKSAILTKEILGLSFQKAPGHKMQVVFRRIDPNNAEDPFVLSVAVVAGKYQVSDCEPAIPDLAQLVDKLNETNNFRSFLVTVRNRFVKLV